MEQIMTANDILNANGARLVIVLTGKLSGPVRTIPESSKFYDEQLDSCTWSYLEAVKNKRGDIIDYKRIFKKINHTSRKITSCQKVIPLTPEHIKAICNEKPNNIRPRDWNTMPLVKRFEASIATFDEGKGVFVEFF